MGSAWLPLGVELKGNSSLALSACSAVSTSCFP